MAGNGNLDLVGMTSDLMQAQAEILRLQGICETVVVLLKHDWFQRGLSDPVKQALDELAKAR